jgi:hypothetical protein
VLVLRLNEDVRVDEVHHSPWSCAASSLNVDTLRTPSS